MLLVPKRFPLSKFSVYPWVPAVQVVVPELRTVQVCVAGWPALTWLLSGRVLDTKVAASTSDCGTTICTVMASPKAVPVPVAEATCIRQVAL